MAASSRQFFEVPSNNQAMSAQDASAQQDGQDTAAGEAVPADTAAADAAPQDDREALLEQARTALADGDEAACQEAVNAAANL